MGSTRAILPVACLCAVFMVALGVTVPAQAQVSTKDVPAPRATAKGKFVYGASVTEMYDDNIFATRTNQIPDAITIFSPYLGYKLDGEKLDLSIISDADIGRHADVSSEDYEDARLKIKSLYQATDTLQVLTQGLLAQEHESRNSVDDVNGLEPTVYSIARAVAAVRKKVGDSSVKVGGTFDRLDFDDVPAAGGTINNDDRDRDVATAGVRVGHWINPNKEIFAEFTYDNRDYDALMDDAGFNRDSDGVRAAAGFRKKIGGDLNVEAYLGWLYQDYDDPLLKDVSSIDFGGRLFWNAARGTTVSAFLERSIEETTLAGASSYLETGVGGSIRHWLRPDMRVDGNVGYYHDEFQGIARNDYLYNAGLGATWYFRPHMYVGTEYKFLRRDSDSLINDYDESRIMVRLGIDNDPTYKPEDLLKPTVPSVDLAGFYVGLQGGITDVGTALFGPRENTGTLRADFADHGLAGGALLGYGANIANWHLALEADVSGSGSGWDHSRTPGGRVFSVDRDVAYGLSGIVGHTFANSSMLYARAGATIAGFDTSYLEGGTLVRDDSNELGFRIGIGATAPIRSNLSFRMEYGYTAFEDTIINYIRGNGQPDQDRFANSESALWLALVYGLQTTPASKWMESLPDYNGFYAGLQGGQGVLVSETTGPRSAGSVLTADFGDWGSTAGLFLGYGVHRGRFVIGVEGEAEISDARWDHERAPTGRSFRLEKKATYGVSVRLGRTFSNGTLLYARAGVVQSDFEINFMRGANTVIKDDSETGVRVGFGMEIPTGEHWSTRLDYTHTTYGDMSLVAPPNNSIERYDPSESLFRLGLARRF